MKNTFTFPAALLTGALLCAVSAAQNASSVQNSSASPSQPEAQAATSSPATSAASQAIQQQPSPATPSPASTQEMANQGQTAGSQRIAPGSVIPVQLTKTIDAKKAKPGDEVTAKVTMDMKANSGEVIVPKDTKVVGHVTEAQTRNKEQKQSQVGIVFDRAMLKNGEISLPMSIQAVIAPPSNDANSNGSYSQRTPTPATSGTTGSSPMGAGRTGSGSSQTQTSNPMPTEGTTPSEGSGARPPITGNTQGVVGISNLKLEPAPNAADGSVLSSEKNNVRVESGTMLLLKVNQ